MDSQSPRRRDRNGRHMGARAQPHLYSELRKYNLHANLKTSAGTQAPEKQLFVSGGSRREISIAEAGEILDRVSRAFFTVDGHESRALMPYPHDPLREPGLWRSYDYLSVKDRLDCLDFPEFEKDLFESNVSTFGSAPGSDIGFTEALRWYALGGHSMAGVFEMAGLYKIGRGGMTSFANAILGEYSGDLLFSTAVKEINHVASGIKVVTTSGKYLHAKTVVCTIPL